MSNTSMLTVESNASKVVGNDCEKECMSVAFARGWYVTFGGGIGTKEALVTFSGRCVFTDGAQLLPFDGGPLDGVDDDGVSQWSIV